MTTRTCKASTSAATIVHHLIPLPPCCPVSGNPRPGSTLRLSYAPSAGIVMPVEDLAAMAAEYVGGLGPIRAQEEMIQHIAARCAAVVRASVRVRADLLILPPDGGDMQGMIVSVRHGAE